MSQGPRVVLWRHGETDWNSQHRFQGSTDIPLNEVGIAQAEAAARHVAVLGPTKIVASPLSRAHVTAGALAELTGLPIETEPALAEVFVGEFEGMTITEVAEADPEFLTVLARGIDYRYSPTGESLSEVGLRFADAVIRWAAASTSSDVVVFASHGMAIRAGVPYLLGRDYSSIDELGFVLNCAWSVLDSLGEGRWRLVSYNNTVPAI